MDCTDPTELLLQVHPEENFLLATPSGVVGHVGCDVHNAAVWVEVRHEGRHNVPGAPVVRLENSLSLRSKLFRVLGRMEVDASVVYQDVNPTVFTHQSLPQLSDLPDISDIQSEKLGP